MDVCDLGGEKVGTIAHVYRQEPVLAGGHAGAGEPPLEEMMEVKTGFLGLGQHLYIPLSAIEDVLSDCVFLSRNKADLEQLNWGERPPRLDELH
jgi:hypothetical protein